MKGVKLSKDIVLKARGVRQKEEKRTCKKGKKEEGERWELKQRQYSRAELCPVPTFLHKNKSSFDLGIHPWAYNRNKRNELSKTERPSVSHI